MHIEVDALDDGFSVELVAQGAEVLLIPLLDVVEVDGACELLDGLYTIVVAHGAERLNLPGAAGAEVVGHHACRHRVGCVEGACGLDGGTPLPGDGDVVVLLIRCVEDDFHAVAEIEHAIGNGVVGVFCQCGNPDALLLSKSFHVA